MGNWYIYFITMWTWCKECEVFEEEVRCGTFYSWNIEVHTAALKSEFGDEPDGYALVRVFKVTNEGAPISGMTHPYVSGSWMKPSATDNVEALFERLDQEATRHELLVSS